jgi:hypothetical protein
MLLIMLLRRDPRRRRRADPADDAIIFAAAADSWPFSAIIIDTPPPCRHDAACFRRRQLPFSLFLDLDAMMRAAPLSAPYAAAAFRFSFMPLTLTRRR